MTLRDPLVVEASPRVPPHSEMSTKPARPDARVTWLASSYVQVLRNPVAHASDGVAIPRFVDAHRAGSLARLDHDVGFSRDDTALKHASSRTSWTARYYHRTERAALVRRPENADGADVFRRSSLGCSGSSSAAASRHKRSRASTSAASAAFLTRHRMGEELHVRQVRRSGDAVSAARGKHRHTDLVHHP